MTDQKIHGNTRKAADADLAKRNISRASYEAILAGELNLDAAREFGRDKGPGGAPVPESRVSKDDHATSATCLCGCGELLGSGGKRTFRPGHDQRLVTYAKEYVRGERELTDEQLEYVERSGKLERARARVEAERQKQQ